MATTAPHTLPTTADAGLEPAERALIAAFGSRTTGVLATVVDTASQQAPDSLVREALWSLMSHGVITTDSRGNLTLHDVPLQNRRAHGDAHSEAGAESASATA
jgi:hypothetical protein